MTLGNAAAVALECLETMASNLSRTVFSSSLLLLVFFLIACGKVSFADPKLAHFARTCLRLMAHDKEMTPAEARSERVGIQ